MLNKKFQKILIVELEDLDEDIQILIKKCEEQHINEEISEYVFLENLAVLKNEIFGVEGFIKDVTETNPDDFNALEDFKKELLNKLTNRIKEKGLAHSITHLVKRKMEKVELYLDHNKL